MADIFHRLDKGSHHFGWSKDNLPNLLVAPGAIVEVQIEDTSGGEITPDTSLEDVGNLDYDKFTPLTGPIAIDGAMPGDTIKVTFLDMSTSGWGWSLITPKYGILPDQFPDPFLKIWHYDRSCVRPVEYRDIAKIPLRPFPGIIGLARNCLTTLSSLPPHAAGGNMDVRDLTVGTELYLPVEVKGGLLSLGDTHVAQGHGELAGTAIESPVDITIKIELVKGSAMPAPHFTLPARNLREVPQRGYHVTCGISTDLYEGARAAASQMIDLLGKLYQISPIDAYLLCSLCGDLVINELVNKPAHVVSLYFPQSVLLD